MKLLAIETSCDETAAAIIEFPLINPHQPLLPLISLSNVVASQIEIHKKWGGVFPELASRAHTEKINFIIRETLEKAHLKLTDIDAFAVTVGPGLIGSLLVGVTAAKTLAMALKKPIYPINHLEGHIYANFIGEIRSTKSEIRNEYRKTNNEQPDFPLIALIVSGGHTMLILMRKHLDYQVIGETLDDAAGEAFDKVAKILGLPYPGGPEVDRLAKKGNPKAFDFPRPMLESKNLDFSFSGLKTAVLYTYQARSSLFENRDSSRTSEFGIRHEGQMTTDETKNEKRTPNLVTDIAASFQEAAVEVLVEKTLKAAEKYQVKSILVGGGVAANSRLRERFSSLVTHYPLRIYLSPKGLATDNALTIAAAAAYHTIYKKPTKWQKVEAVDNLKL